MHIEQDDFPQPPTIQEAKEDNPRWDHESEADYERRMERTRELYVDTFKISAADRRLREPFYPLLEHLEAHISKEAASVRKAIEAAKNMILQVGIGIVAALIALRYFR